jgi:phosphonate transport system substrate-binding protein
MKTVRLLTFSTAIFTALSWLPSVVLADITMGVFPRRPAAVTAKAFQPLADHLSQALGEKVELVIPKDFKAFWKGVESKKFDLVHYNQYHYIKSHKELGYNVIATSEEFGSKQIAGALAVRKDSGVNTVADLKGKAILFGGGKKAMGSYIAPTAILKKAGLEAGKDYKVAFAKNPPSAVVGAFHKAADASGSGNVILKIKAVTKQIDTSEMKILAESEPFIHLSWAVKDGFPQDKTQKIQAAMAALINTDEGKKILKAAKVTSFHAASDADYAKVREITKFAIGEDY